MANRNDKAPNNVPGKFYCDNSCIACGQCIDIAPNNFAQADGDGMYVKIQPTNEEGLKICKEAMEACPVEAIGDDGE